MNVAGPSWAHPVEYEEDLTRMIAQLDLTDIERLQAVYDDRVDILSDHEVAFTLLMQNAREIAQFNADRELAQRFAIDGVEELDLTLRPETRVQPVVAPEPAVGKTTQTWSGWAASFFLMPISSDPTSSSQAPTTVAPRSTGHDCVICQDPIFEPEVRAPCGHFYDIGCVTDLFQSATRDESLYPPRCCRQIIPLPRVRPHLTQALIAEFELKTREFGTVKRLYCATPACSRFLGPLYKGFFSDVFTCTSPTCTTATCGKCRGIYEGRNHNCTPDAETERMLTLSRASGWSRCPGCAQMIELNMGCYHMTCRCKTEFCYLCSARWKSCGCPQWDENRLLATAERQVDAQLQPAHRAQPANPPQQAPAVPRRPALAADAARNQPILLPREAVVAAPNPAPAQAPLPAPLPWTTRYAEAQAQAPPPAPPPRRTRAETQAPPPAPSHRGTRRAETQAQAPPAAASPRRTRRAEAQVQAPPPVPPPWSTLRAEVQAQALPLAASPRRTRRADARPQVHHPVPPPRRTRRAEAQAQTPSSAPPPPRLARVPESHPASTTNTATTGEVRECMVRETMERLRMDHDCQHTTWKYQRGSGHCENCSADLPNYIYRCGDCQMLSCGRCQQNRL